MSWQANEIQVNLTTSTLENVVPSELRLHSFSSLMIPSPHNLHRKKGGTFPIVVKDTTGCIFFRNTLSFTFQFHAQGDTL